MLVHIKPKNSTNIQHDKFDKLLKLDYLKTTILQIAHSCMWSHNWTYYGSIESYQNKSK